tara:strand:+ start:350 stop:541 length:192 start_codon:yes stop_codon:yes gene_type:complete
MRLTRGRFREKRVIKKIKIPEIITEDLSYYMQFGFKRIPPTDNGKYMEVKHDKVRYNRINFYE